MSDVAVFTRAPNFGSVKTRLAAAIGDQNALACHSALLAGIVEQASGFDAEIWVDGASADGEDVWAGDLPVRGQPVGDLGQRMLAAFKSGVRIVVGSDIPLLTAAHIEHALSMLDANDLVVGPTEDGGYYLIGMSTPRPELFDGVEWGTAVVLEQTLARAKGLSVGFCETLWDVDEEPDYQRWLATL